VIFPRAPNNPHLQSASIGPGDGESLSFVSSNPPFPGFQAYCTVVCPLPPAGFYSTDLVIPPTRITPPLASLDLSHSFLLGVIPTPSLSAPILLRMRMAGSTWFITPLRAIQIMSCWGVNRLGLYWFQWSSSEAKAVALHKGTQGNNMFRNRIPFTYYYRDPNFIPKSTPKDHVAPRRISDRFSFTRRVSSGSLLISGLNHANPSICNDTKRCSVSWLLYSMAERVS
jgi:hypothetical protein